MEKYMSKVSNKPIRKNDRGLKYKRRMLYDIR